MEIPAWLFVSFWAVISITSLHLGFLSLDKTELSHSVPPVVMFLFKHSLAVLSCFSSSYALKFRAQSTYAVRSNFVLLVYVFFSFINPRTIEGILIWHVLKVIFGWLLHFHLKLKIFFGMISPFLWRILLSIAFIIMASVLCTELLMFLTIICGVALVHSIYLFAIWYGHLLEYAISWVLSRFEFLLLAWAFLIKYVGIFYYAWAFLIKYVGIFYYVYLFVQFCFLVYGFILVCTNNFSELKTRASLLLVLEMSIFFVSVNKNNFSPILVLSISHLISVCWAALSRSGDYPLVYEDSLGDDKSGEGSVGIALKMLEVLSKFKEHKAKKFIEFAVGTVGAVLFQHYFRITSFSEVAVFLCFAVTWLANLVLLGFCVDFGVFNFLLANVVVGCTVGPLGFQGATWVAVGAAILLFVLRLILESVAIAYEEAELIQFSFFGNK